MSIPRPFYGMNYFSKLIANFQDRPFSKCQRLEFHEIEDVTPIHLPEKTPMELNISAAGISALLRELMAKRPYTLDGIAISQGDSLIFAGYRPPHSSEVLHITNSACKTVIAIGIMFAMSEGLLKEEDFVLSFFPEYETLLTPKYVKQITIKHLLTMTSCSKCNESISAVEENWVKAFLTSDCQKEPGEKYIYNSMNTYMLAAVLTKVTGQSVMEYLKSRFFAPLGMNHIKWELCPMGIERGGWGMRLSLEDMLKIGIFLAKDGAFMGKQLIHPSYIRKMKQVRVRQDADSLATAYGYQIWHLPKNLYMLSGMYGQHVIVDEVHQLVVATNAHDDKMFPDSSMVRTIIRFMTNPALYHSGNRKREFIAWQNLKQEFQIFCNGWQLPEKGKMPYQLYRMQKKKELLQEVSKLQEHFKYFDKTGIHIDNATFQLFPYMLQGMYQYPPFLVSDMTFEKQEKSVKIGFYKVYPKKEEADSLVLTAGFMQYYNQILQIGENKEMVSVKVYPSSDEEGREVILLEIVFPAMGFSRRIKLFLFDEKIEIECQEYPDMRGILSQVLYGDAVIAGNTFDFSDIIPESVRVFLRHKVEPSVTGHVFHIDI